MHKRTFKSLLALGFDTNLIEKVGSLSHTLEVLRSLSRRALQAHYDDREVGIILQRIKRKPIRDTTLDAVINAADRVCCFCADGNQARPYQIHHAVEYFRTQDNSEENLILICPTHHQSVPKQLTLDEQKAVRREWHAVASIARAYRLKGIDFPYGAFVALDYAALPQPAQLIEGYALSNSTALDVSRNPFALRAVERLRRERFLVIAGASGDGKTTLALGVAGHLRESGSLVFSYRPSQPPSVLALQEVMKFVSIVDWECVLVLDDANRYFSESDLHQIQRITGPVVSVIATWTRHEAGSARFERKLPGWFLVNWEQLRPGVHDYLLRNEGVISPAIRRRQDTHEMHRVGLGHLDERLVTHLNRYGATVKTVSEYLFLIRGGSEVAREIEVLSNQDRSDIPVLFAAIEQIAGFEKTVTPDQAANTPISGKAGSRLPASTPDWVRYVFETECKRGFMQKIRGSYTTIHRDWAARLISQGLASPRTKPELEKMLAPNLDLSSPEPARLLRLWSWLSDQPHAGPFVRTFLAAQSRADWITFVGQAALDGLETVGFAADRMHRLFQHPDWIRTIADAFATHEKRVARLVNSATQEDWYLLTRIEFALKHAAPVLAARIWEAWPPVRAAAVIADTHPDYYEWLWWAISGVKEHSPAWIETVGRELSWEHMSKRLSQTRRGDLESVIRCKDILSTLGVPIRRSMLRRLGEALGKTLSGSPLPEVHVGAPPLVDPNWWFFSEDIQIVEEDAYAKQLAGDLSRGTPREWRIFAGLANFEVPKLAAFCRRVVDQTHLSTLVKNVQAHAEGHEYELRCLLWIFARANQEQRTHAAAQLYPLVLAACNRSDTERPMLAEALKALDSALGERLLSEAQIEPNQLRNVPPPDLPAFFEKMAPIQERFRKLEESGIDYVVDFGFSKD